MQQNNYNKSSKVSKIDFSYLIVGIDVAKTNQYARMCDCNCQELGKKIVFTRNKAGFNKLNLAIEAMKQKYQKTKVLILMEATGIYWSNIYNYYKNLDESIEVGVVDVKDVINIRKLFFPSVKSDTVDSLAIAKTALIKGYKQKLELTEKERELRDIITFKERLIKQRTALKNIITNILDEMFPEYKTVYKDYFCKGSLVILNEFYSPDLINNLTFEELQKKIRSIDKKKWIKKNKLIKLKEAAKESIGVKLSTAKIAEFKFNLESLSRLIDRINSIDSQVVELMKDNEKFKAMTKIKGMSTVTAANLLSIVGDFSKFMNPKQLIAYCGLNLRLSESGTHKGKTSISKSGNSIMRSYLFRAIMPILRANEDFKLLHEHYKTRKDNPLKPMQSIIALMCKLLRILWGMSKNNVQYDSSKAFPNATAQAA